MVSIGRTDAQRETIIQDAQQTSEVADATVQNADELITASRESTGDSSYYVGSDGMPMPLLTQEEIETLSPLKEETEVMLSELDEQIAYLEVVDPDGNGMVDEGTYLLPNGETLEVAAGEEIDLADNYTQVEELTISIEGNMAEIDAMEFENLEEMIDELPEELEEFGELVSERQDLYEDLAAAYDELENYDPATSTRTKEEIQSDIASLETKLEENDTAMMQELADYFGVEEDPPTKEAIANAMMAAAQDPEATGGSNRSILALIFAIMMESAEADNTFRHSMMDRRAAARNAAQDMGQLQEQELKNAGDDAALNGMVSGSIGIGSGALTAVGGYKAARTASTSSAPAPGVSVDATATPAPTGVSAPSSPASPAVNSAAAPAQPNVANNAPAPQNGVQGGQAGGGQAAPQPQVDAGGDGGNPAPAAAQDPNAPQQPQQPAGDLDGGGAAADNQQQPVAQPQPEAPAAVDDGAQPVQPADQQANANNVNNVDGDGGGAPAADNQPVAQQQPEPSAAANVDNDAQPAAQPAEPTGAVNDGDAGAPAPGNDAATRANITMQRWQAAGSMMSSAGGIGTGFIEQDQQHHQAEAQGYATDQATYQSLQSGADQLAGNQQASSTAARGYEMIKMMRDVVTQILS